MNTHVRENYWHGTSLILQFLFCTAPGSSLRHKLFKLFNPGSDAYVVDLPQEEEKAYYDEKRKVWVFPGDNPDELVKPIGPPPTMGASSIPSTPAPQPSASSDPLAAMMAPPSRGPASMKRTGVGGAHPVYPGMIPGSSGGPGSAPPTAGGPPPQFAVFQPKPVPSDEVTSEG